MKWMFQLWLYQSCIAICLLGYALGDLGDPYKILGVHRKASTQEIRKAYKQLAKAWHPDKSNDPSAGEKFVEIKQAYEVLSDPERRRTYDNYGVTEDTFYDRPQRDAFHTNPFEDIFGQHGGYFNFQENDITFFHKLSITTRQFDKLIVPKSEKTPYLIFFYTDWCFPCLQSAPYCRKLVDYLEPLGINFVTVHSEQEVNLARRLSIHTLPCLVLLLDGHGYVYKGTITSVQSIIDFIKEKMPYKLIPRLKNGDDVDNFLNGWEDNKVRGLIFEPNANMRLRYFVTAYHFRNRVKFGFVNSRDIWDKYQLPEDMDSVLLFNENTSRPMASVTMKEIPTSTLYHVISTNQFLALPRLSSQAMLEALCPCEWNRPRKRLCVVLVTEDSNSHNSHREAFRVFAQNSPYSTEKVRFAYIYKDKQTEFISALIPDGAPLEPILRVVILWRRDTTHVKYEWISDKWECQDNLNDTTVKLENTISRLLKSNEALTHEAYVKDLYDEHAKSIFGRIFSKIFAFIDSLYESLNKDQILPALSVLGTIVFILIIGYFMAYLVRLEEENIQKQKAKAKSRHNNNNNNGTSAISSYQPELRLHELRAEKYNGLVRLLKPGCRTILLLLDMQSRQQLIPPFHKAVWPYRKNKTLMFSYMYIERGLSWYKELLELSLPGERELNINPRNCVGTVLSLNGHRKYFCIFHAKHNERKNKNKDKKKPSAKEDWDFERGAFIGFDSESSESEEEILLQSNLLDGLPNWLDRLFEGTTQRFYINYWPDFPNK